jgi:hypothetical protein
MEALLSFVMDGLVWLISGLGGGKRSGIVSILIAGVGMYALLYLLFAVGPNITLTCTRVGTGVQCNIEERLVVWPLTIGGLGYVTGAINDQNCTNSGCGYRVLLLTLEGNRPLRNEYAIGSKADFVNRLNSFIANKNRASIELVDSGGLSPQFLTNCLFSLLAIGLAVLGLLLLFWGYRSRRNH